jgi:RpiR family transcriptional regulator, carbohydrate utilization regulator
MDKRINTLTQLKALSLDMTDSENLIASHILNNPEEIYSLKIEELAKKLKISLPTVFRFAKKLGFEGFKDFKVALIRDMAIGINIEAENIEDDSIGSITRNVFEKASGNLNETLSIINYDDLSKTVDFIVNAKRLIFFAVSYSMSVALDCYSKFLGAGFNCIYDTNTYSQRVISTQCTGKDVAIGISFSGASPEVLDCMRNARQGGAKTICITTFMKSPITETADVSLYTAPVSSRHQRIDIPSKMSYLAILDSIYLSVVLKNRARALDYISRTEEELGKYNKTFKDLKDRMLK